MDDRKTPHPSTSSSIRGGWGLEPCRYCCAEDLGQGLHRHRPALPSTLPPCPSRSIAKSTTPIRIHVAITPHATRDALPAKKRAVSWWFWWGIHAFRSPNLPSSCWFSIPCFLFFGFFSLYFPPTGGMPNSCFHWLRAVSWENLYCECARIKWWFFKFA